MFPPFIDSFGDQLSAVLINTFGTILAGIFGGVINAFVTGFLTPLFRSVAAAIGIPV
ncbi:MAG: hypothetical protein L6Q92_07515 [Phycisphaerae bacterium]|nr:hypothetical protein [Phycisphaerae bacterium]